jgi:hypothetical protein
LELGQIEIISPEIENKTKDKVAPVEQKMNNFRREKRFKLTAATMQQMIKKIIIAVEANSGMFLK